MVEIDRGLVGQPGKRATGGVLHSTHLPGLVPYLPMWDRQRRLAARRARGDIGDLLLLLEHEHVYTNGRRGDPAHLLADNATLVRLGAAYHTIDRGGDITYHGPGQLVGYPIMHLNDAGLGLRSYVHGLEQAIVRAVAAFGVEATTIPGSTGVWLGESKLAAIGVKISGGVAYHGFALNVATDLSYLKQIVPCGLPDRAVTSLEQILGQRVSLDEVARACGEALAGTFDRELQWTDPPTYAAIHGTDILDLSMSGRRLDEVESAVHA